MIFKVDSNFTYKGSALRLFFKFDWVVLILMILVII